MCAWPRVRRGGLLARLGVACALAALALVLLESGLRLVIGGGSEWLFGPPHIELTLATDPIVMPGVTGAATTRLDRLGLRVDRDGARASPRVLCLGGSTTECAALDQDEAWPRLLEQRLGPGAWVAAAGRSGATSRAHVLQLERAPAVDLVLCLVGVNDLALALERGASFRVRGLDDPALRAATLQSAFFDRPLDPAWWPPRRSLTWRLLDRARRARWARAAAARDLPARYVAWRALRAAAVPLRDTAPDLTAPLAEYQRNLRAMCARARARGVELVFLTQPVLWRPDLAPREEALLWFGWVGRAPAQGTPEAYHSTAVLTDGMARYNAALRAVCAQEGLTCVDLAAALNGDPRWFYDDCHLSEAGARRVAELVHAALE